MMKFLKDMISNNCSVLIKNAQVMGDEEVGGSQSFRLVQNMSTETENQRQHTRMFLFLKRALLGK
jgi:hypothetical protein